MAYFKTRINNKANQQKIQKKKSKKKKSFQLQINCQCKRKCADKIDVLKQQEIFEEFNKNNDWPNQTRFLRSLISHSPQKEKLDPIIGAKQKENSYAYHFIDENRSLTRVCLSFFTKVLQINRSKVFRAVDSIKKIQMQLKNVEQRRFRKQTLPT